MRAFLALALVGCGPAGPDLTAVTDPAERACVEKACPTGDLDACRAGPCKPTPASWAVAPTRIRVADGAVLVEAALTHSHAKFGDVEVARAHDAYVGVTVATEDGREIDLAVQTLNKDALEQPFLFTADVDGTVQDVLIGVWDQKIEPCSVDRSGCKEFGFVLDGSLASWPPNLYVDFKRQRIPPPSVTFLVERTKKPTPAIDAARTTLEAALAPFGAALNASSHVPAAPVDKDVLAYGHAHDEVIATQVAAAAGVPAVLDAAVDGFVLRLADDPAHAACAAPCQATLGTDAAACLDQACP